MAHPALGAVLACSSQVPVPTATPHSSDYDIVVSNHTRIPVTLAVNGSVARVVSPRTQERVPTTALPALPWTVQARTSGGGVLTSLTVRDGDVLRMSNSMQGDATRVDLSCGRLDVVVGPPLLGPSPGPGHPGDCDP